jgi:hypothetical protein
MFENKHAVGARRTVFVAVAVLTTLLVSGCAGLGSSEPPELIVRKLATQRWQALLARDFDKAYAFAAPGYRKIHSLEYYRSNRQPPVRWLSAEIMRVECVQDRCKVMVELDSKPTIPFAFRGNIKSGIEEVWVFEDRRWWMLEAL